MRSNSVAVRTGAWSLIFLLISVSAFISVRTVVVAANDPRLTGCVTSPETGFHFPTASEISEIKASTGFGPDKHDFKVPKNCWANVFAALSPSAYDPSPKKWQVLGDLDILTKRGDKIYVALYSLQHRALGAFSVGPTVESLNYYRGGNTDRLEAALEQARIAAEATEKARISFPAR